MASPEVETVFTEGNKSRQTAQKVSVFHLPVPIKTDALGFFPHEWVNKPYLSIDILACYFKQVGHDESNDNNMAQSTETIISEGLGEEELANKPEPIRKTKKRLHNEHKQKEEMKFEEKGVEETTNDTHPNENSEGNVTGFHVGTSQVARERQNEDNDKMIEDTVGSTGKEPETISVEKSEDQLRKEEEEDDNDDDDEEEDVLYPESHSSAMDARQKTERETDEKTKENEETETRIDKGKEGAGSKVQSTQQRETQVEKQERTLEEAVTGKGASEGQVGNTSEKQLEAGSVSQPPEAGLQPGVPSTYTSKKSMKEKQKHKLQTKLEEEKEGAQESFPDEKGDDVANDTELNTGQTGSDIRQHSLHVDRGTGDKPASSVDEPQRVSVESSEEKQKKHERVEQQKVSGNIQAEVEKQKKDLEPLMSKLKAEVGKTVSETKLKPRWYPIKPSTDEAKKKKRKKKKLKVKKTINQTQQKAIKTEPTEKKSVKKTKPKTKKKTTKKMEMTKKITETKGNKNGMKGGKKKSGWTQGSGKTWKNHLPPTPSQLLNEAASMEGAVTKFEQSQKGDGQFKTDEDSESFVANPDKGKTQTIQIQKQSITKEESTTLDSDQAGLPGKEQKGKEKKEKEKAKGKGKKKKNGDQKSKIKKSKSKKGKGKKDKDKKTKKNKKGKTKTDKGKKGKPKESNNEKGKSTTKDKGKKENDKKKDKS